MPISNVQLISNEVIMKDPRPMVNGNMLARYIKKPVCLLATVRNVQANGRILSLTTTDGKMPVAQLAKPLDEPPAEGTWVEVNGIVENPTKITCHDLYAFPAHLGELDTDLFNEYLALVDEFCELDELSVAENLGEGGPTAPEIYELEDWMKTNDQAADGETDAFNTANGANEHEAAEFFDQL